MNYSTGERWFRLLMLEFKEIKQKLDAIDKKLTAEPPKITLDLCTPKNQSMNLTGICDATSYLPDDVSLPPYLKQGKKYE